MMTPAFPAPTAPDQGVWTMDLFLTHAKWLVQIAVAAVVPGGWLLVVLYHYRRRRRDRGQPVPAVPKE